MIHYVVVFEVIFLHPSLERYSRSSCYPQYLGIHHSTSHCIKNANHKMNLPSSSPHLSSPSITSLLSSPKSPNPLPNPKTPGHILSPPSFLLRLFTLCHRRSPRSIRHPLQPPSQKAKQAPTDSHKLPLPAASAKCIPRTPKTTAKIIFFIVLSVSALAIR